MRYIPKAASKVVVFHPACIMPSEVQEQLQTMTSNFLVKATGAGLAAAPWGGQERVTPSVVQEQLPTLPPTSWPKPRVRACARALHLLLMAS